jgi:hypothetical protein
MLQFKLYDGLPHLGILECLRDHILGEVTLFSNLAFHHNDFNNILLLC